MMKINALKRKNNNLNIGYEKDIDIVKINEFINGLPFELTTHQKEALNDIFKDLKSNKRMNRLLEGDVGSGKTIVALISMYALYLSGYQSALMVPTEVLANQHYENFKNLLEGYNIEIALLTGSTKKSEKNKIYDRLKSGKINMVIGTHAKSLDFEHPITGKKMHLEAELPDYFKKVIDICEERLKRGE